MDVEELYYSMPPGALTSSVKACITQQNDEESFIGTCGVSKEGFLEILSFYLDSTVIGWKGSCYVRKNGVCFGSSVALAFSNIFLGMVGAQRKKCSDTWIIVLFL